jgi:thymidine kinase
MGFNRPLKKLSVLLALELVLMSLELIVGPMFAGKSTEAVKWVRSLQAAKVPCFIITSHADRRYDPHGESICTHSGDRVSAVGLKSLTGIVNDPLLQAATYVLIEEAQFFPDLYEVVMDMVENLKKKVLVFGLDGDSERKPFGQILDLIPKADMYRKLTAICRKCKDVVPAVFTKKIMYTGEGQVCIGGEAMYMAVCRMHYLEQDA